jgi:hypothetical protein
VGRAPVGVLQDSRAGVDYEIDYAARRALMRRRLPAGEAWTPPSPPTAESWAAHHLPELYLGKKVVNGIECEGWRNSGAVGGEQWIAPSLNYSYVLITILQTGKHFEHDFSLQDIQVGEIPDPKLFKVPSNFTVVSQ